MSPHQVLALLTQDQISEMLVAASQFLSVERISSALKEGLEPHELVQLKNILIDLSEETD